MPKLADSDLKLLIDASVSVAAALATGSIAPLAAPVKGATERVITKIGLATKTNALRRNVEKQFTMEASQEAISLGIALAARTAPSLTRKLFIELNGDRDIIATHLLASVAKETASVELEIAHIALRSLLKNSIDALQQEPAMATTLAVLEIERAKEAEADRRAFLPTPTDATHDWTTGFIAERDRRRLADPRTGQEMVGIEMQPLAEQLRKSWRGDISEATRRIATPKWDGELADAVSGIRSLDLQGSYPSLLLRLRSTQVQSWLTTIRKSSAAEFEGALECRAARTWANWLIDQASRPTMRLVFPILGQWGSGKARLLLELSQAWQHLSAPVVFVRRSGSASLEEAILGSCRESLGRLVDNRAQLAAYAKQFNSPLLVIIDRLDEMERTWPGSYREFADLVETWSDHDCLRWAVAIDHNTLVRMPAQMLRVFWPMYGAFSPDFRRLPPESLTQSAGGFLDLDSHNFSRHTGLQILSRHGAESDKRSLGYAPGTLSEEAALALSAPLAAWVRIESNDRLPLGDVHGQVFLTDFWEIAIESMEDSGPPSGAIRAYIAAVASYLAKGITPQLEYVEEDARPNQSGYVPNASQAVIESREALIQIGLIEVSGADIHIPEEYMPLWGYQAALAILDSSGMPDQNVDELDLRAATSDRLAECALSSLVGLLLNHGEASTQLLTDWLGRDPLTWGPAWEAALNFDEGLLSRFVGRQDATLTAVTSERHAYLIIRTARLRNLEAAEDAGRMIRLVGRAMPAAKALGLADFSFGALANQLTAVDWSAPGLRQSVLATLNQFDEPRYDYELARIVVTLADEGIGLEAFLPVLAEFLNRSAELQFPSDHPGLFEGDRAARDLLPFWRALTRLTLEDLFKSLGPAFILTLAAEGWLRSEVDVAKDSVWFAALQEANVAFGHRFHSEHRPQFVQLVENLAAARVVGLEPNRQREIALFGIRHTESTHGGDVTVDESLRTAYDSLVAARSFAKNHSRWLRSIHIGKRREPGPRRSRAR